MKPALLYDGHCRFCIHQMERLARWLPPGGYQALDFQQPGVLDRFGVSRDEAMRALHLVDGRGRVYAGAEAAVRAVGLRPLGKIAYLYFVPGVRQLADAIYKVVARNRYKIAGTTCEDGTCALHASLSSRSSPAEPSRTR